MSIDLVGAIITTVMGQAVPIRFHSIDNNFESTLSFEEQRILDSITVPSDSDPTKPEFPFLAPCFPATPTYQINVPGFSSVYLKDESKNPTGTHKDRMAWEIIVTYRRLLLAKKHGAFSGPLPSMSLISSGSAAVAIQTQLKYFGLPSLRVLVDFRIRAEIRQALIHLGCLLFETDLGSRELSTSDILRLTGNPNGFDITCGTPFDSSTKFYDWLSYEIVNESPEYCFMPFGTGTLYENVLQVVKREVTSLERDNRFLGNRDTLCSCNYYGATSYNSTSKADKLYAPHLPFSVINDQWLRFYKTAGFCGARSNVVAIEELSLSRALEIAKANGVCCEPSGIAGLALLLQEAQTIPPAAKILIVNTGNCHLSANCA